MKHVFILAMASTLWISASFAQTTPVISWSRAYGGSNMDFLTDMELTDAGGTIMAGNVVSNNGDVSGSHGSIDAWVVEVDQTGEVIWQRCYGGSHNDSFHSMVRRSGGGYVLAGYSRSINGDVIGNHGTSSDAWVVAINDSGDIDWQLMVGGSAAEEANDIQKTADGGYIITGMAESTDGDLSANAGDNDLLIFKLDSAGILEWTRTYGGSSADVGYSVTELSNGNFVVVGITMSSDGDVTGHHGSLDGWIIGLDPEGQLSWQRAWGGSNTERASSVLANASGGCIVSISGGATGDGDIVQPQGGSDVYLLGFNATGAINWTRQYGTNGEDSCNKIERTADGGLLLLGGYWICQVTKLNPVYDHEWTITDGPLSSGSATSCQIRPDGRILVMGNIMSEPTSVPAFHGLADGYLIEFTFDYDLVRGTTFIDMDSDAVWDQDEEPLAQHMFHITGTDRNDLSNGTGSFELSVLDTGSCSTVPSSLTHYTPIPGSHNSYFSAFGQLDDTPVFAMQPNGTVNDLSVDIVPMGAFRPGMWAQYMVVYKNEGTTSLTPILSMQPDPYLTFVNADPSPDYLTDSLIWSLPELGPLQQRSFTLTFSVAFTAPVYSPVNSSIKIWPLEDDAIPENNQATGLVTYTSSCDPNIIRVDREVIDPMEIDGSLALEYTIEFQNTGNDTAFTVVVKNPWPINCNMNSFQFMSTSHPASINMDNDNAVIWFQFDNILLPDSTTNEAESHGYIRYRIRPQADLVVGDSMLNNVGIYFDFNEPVITNTAITTISSTTLINERAVDQVFKIYPNPAKQSIIVEFFELISDGQVKVTDATGRCWIKSMMNTSSMGLDVSSLARGIYFVSISSDQREYVEKIILE